MLVSSECNQVLLENYYRALVCNMATLTPIEQLNQDIIDLEAQRETVYAQFKEIEANLLQKRKLVEAFQLVKDSESLQESLITELINLGLLTD